MKIVSFNVNGVRAILKKGFPECLDSLTPDVIVLEELKLSEDKEESFPFKKEGYKTYFTISKVKKGYLIDEVNNLPTKIAESEIEKRRDFREICTFTIDPADAKDFDDALSFQKLENGNYEVGVHIADVSHYVKEDSAMDKEAFKRATSVYLVDRVNPMFPELLSNIICSLRPKEEKLCFSAVFELDENANVKKEWFGRTVIFSQKRFSYEEA